MGGVLIFSATKRLEVKLYLPELRGDIGADHPDLPIQENELLCHSGQLIRCCSLWSAQLGAGSEIQDSPCLASDPDIWPRKEGNNIGLQFHIHSAHWMSVGGLLTSGVPW